MQGFFSLTVLMSKSLAGLKLHLRINEGFWDKQVFFGCRLWEVMGENF